MSDSTLNLAPFLTRHCDARDGVWYCLTDATKADVVKATDIETYTVRAKDFDTQSMLKLSPVELASLQPFQALPDDALILEIGCGDGRFGIELMRRGHRVIETDIAPGSVEKVRDVAVEAQPGRGGFAVVDAEDLPFTESAFDAVYMVATLHHLPDPQKAMAEIRRVLKPGGLLVILREPAMWQYYLLAPVFWFVRTISRTRDPHHISLADDVTHGFTRGRLRQMLSSGFDAVRITPVQYLEKWYINTLVALGRIFKRNMPVHHGLQQSLYRIDRGIAAVPGLRATTWDWDIVAKKR